MCPKPGEKCCGKHKVREQMFRLMTFLNFKFHNSHLFVEVNKQQPTNITLDNKAEHKSSVLCEEVLRSKVSVLQYKNKSLSIAM